VTWPLSDGRLVAHRPAPGGRVLMASPAYLATRGEPRSLEALEDHRAILYSHRETDWRFQAAGGVRVVRPTAGLRVNNGMFIHDAALAGPRTASAWSVASPTLEPTDRDPGPADMPGPSHWRRLATEANGLANMSRAFGLTAWHSSRKLIENGLAALIQSAFG
jgi:DNA-binding transcriptional LysR family regulator